MDFTGFLGNDAVKARLSGAFASGRVAHSYLLCGPAGSGKHTLTRILSAAMQCEGRSGKIPCGVCSGCRKALEGVHPDIITVDDPDHKAMTVDPIRAARSDMFIRPNEGKRKIYIIPRGQDMNESAQNALLKLYLTDKRFESEAHVKNWLYRVAANECKRALLSPWRRAEDIADYAEKLAFTEPERSELFYAVMELSAKYRAVIHLHYY